MCSQLWSRVSHSVILRVCPVIKSEWVAIPETALRRRTWWTQAGVRVSPRISPRGWSRGSWVSTAAVTGWGAPSAKVGICLLKSLLSPIRVDSESWGCLFSFLSPKIHPILPHLLLCQPSTFPETHTAFYVIRLSWYRSACVQVTLILFNKAPKVQE